MRLKSGRGQGAGQGVRDSEGGSGSGCGCVFQGGAVEEEGDSFNCLLGGS
jgi:hypothetical protein